MASGGAEESAGTEYRFVSKTTGLYGVKVACRVTPQSHPRSGSGCKDGCSSRHASPIVVGWPCDLSVVVGQTLSQQMGVERLKGGDLRDRDEAVGAVEAHAVLDAALLVALARQTKMALKQLVTAKENERLRLLPGVPGENALHSHLEVIVCEAMGGPPENAGRPAYVPRRRLPAVGRETPG